MVHALAFEYRLLEENPFSRNGEEVDIEHFWVLILILTFFDVGMFMSSYWALWGFLSVFP